MTKHVMSWIRLSGAGALLLVVATAWGQTPPTLTETSAPIRILDPDDGTAVIAMHTPRLIKASDGTKNQIYLFFHAGRLNATSNTPLGTRDQPCADGDAIRMAVINPLNIAKPASITGGYNQIVRVSPCSTDGRIDSTGALVAPNPTNPNGTCWATGAPPPAGKKCNLSWSHGSPFTAEGHMGTGEADDFITISRGDAVTGTHKTTFLFRTAAWDPGPLNSAGTWLAGIYPIITIDAGYIDQVSHVNRITFPTGPSEKLTEVIGGQTVKTVIWHGYFRFAGQKMGRIKLEFSPGKYGQQRPTRVWIQRPAGQGETGPVWVNLGPTGVLNFVPHNAHKELTGQTGTPVQIYKEGTKYYLLTREQTTGHNNHYPMGCPSTLVCPSTLTSTSPVYCLQRGKKSYRILIREWRPGHIEEPAYSELQSIFRTVGHNMPTDYSVSFEGGSLVLANQVRYFVSADRDDDICTVGRCINGTEANEFCGLQISTSQVNLTPPQP